MISSLHSRRHAQGFHNVAGEANYSDYKNEKFEDAYLTPKGEAQCAALNSSCIESAVGITSELLVVSPMRRTLSTAMCSFPGFVQKIPWLAHETLRETAGMHPCDRRRPISEHAESYPNVDFSLIDENEDPLYYLQEGRESDESVTERAHSFFIWLASRKEKEIIVVTHSAFLKTVFKYVLEIDTENEEENYGCFKNCEMKSYLLYF